MTIRTFNRFHLGDNLLHLQLLRRLAQQNPSVTFEHKAHGQYLGAMQGLITDLPNIQLLELMDEPVGEIDAWRGANGFWYAHPKRNDFLAFHLEHFDFLCQRMGLPCPIKSAEDMLFDSPALNPDNLSSANIDVLIINSAPQSNQWSGYSEEGFLALQRELRKRGLTTINSEQLRAQGWSIAQVGAFAGKCHWVIGTAHGPLWPSINIWTAKTMRRWICFTGTGESLNGLHPCVLTLSNIMDALDYL